MYELLVWIDDKTDKYIECPDLESALRAVNDYFLTFGDGFARLPFDAEVDDKGRIVQMSLHTNPDEKFWQAIYATCKSGAHTFLIKRVVKAKEDGTWHAPTSKYRGGGAALVAAQKSSIADVVYLNDYKLTGDSEFGGFRDYLLAAADRLCNQGDMVGGIMAVGRFKPLMNISQPPTDEELAFLLDLVFEAGE